MRNETKIYLLYILQRLQSCINYVFYHVHKKASPMHFIEIFTYCSILLVARLRLFSFEGKQAFDTTAG